jgi:hypothetical protein
MPRGAKQATPSCSRARLTSSNFIEGNHAATQHGFRKTTKIGGPACLPIQESPNSRDVAQIRPSAPQPLAAAEFLLHRVTLSQHAWLFNEMLQIDHCKVMTSKFDIIRIRASVFKFDGKRTL